jgi:ribose transport system permease protein
MSAWRYRLAEHGPVLLAIVLFLGMFTLYISNHSAGLTANVATTAANKGVLFALVAMAQTLPVLTGGLDLSVPSITASRSPSGRRRAATSTPTSPTR